MKVSKEQFLMHDSNVVHEPTNAVYKKSDRGIQLLRRGTLGQSLRTGDYYDEKEVSEAARGVLDTVRATGLG